MIPPERKPGKDTGVLPKASVGAPGSARVEGLVHSPIHPLPGAEPHLFGVLLSAVGWHLPRFSAQLPVRSVSVYAYPLTEHTAPHLSMLSFCKTFIFCVQSLTVFHLSLSCWVLMQRSKRWWVWWRRTNSCGRLCEKIHIKFLKCCPYLWCDGKNFASYRSVSFFSSCVLQLFALQTESREQREGEEIVHHKLPAYVQNMDRLGDTELWDTNITVFTDD